MLQTELAKQLKALVARYEQTKCNPNSRSDAVLRPELQYIFSCCNCYYEPHQQNTYMATPITNEPLLQKDWRWDIMLRRVWKFCPSRWHRDQVDNRKHPIDVLCDLDLTCKDRNDLSQHGAWCMDVLYAEACLRTGLRKEKGRYVAMGNGPYSDAGDLMLNDEQKRLLTWDTLSAVNRGNILEASATLAMITEPQQTVWLRHLLLQTFELAHGKTLTGELLSSHDWLDEPLSATDHPHLFPLRTTAQ